MQYSSSVLSQTQGLKWKKNEVLDLKMRPQN
jgi:hypothetical protein